MERCIVCSSKSLTRKVYNQHKANTILYSLKKFLNLLEEDSPFQGHINICNSCGHGVMKSLPTASQVEEYYKQEYWESRPTNAQALQETKETFKTNLRALHQIDFVADEISQASIHDMLEIGAGSAYASQLLRYRFNPALDINVCEPGESWKEYYQSNSIKIVAGYFPFETDRQFDYIHTSHWLEHVIDLNDTVFNLNKILNRSGFIFVEVPNTQYHYWDLPLKDTPHIQFFTRSSLVKIFEKHGFENVKTGAFGQTFYQKFKRIPLTAADYGPSNEGFWIRSLFRKL